MEAAAEDHRVLLAVADERPGEGLVLVRDLHDGERRGAVAGVVEEVERRGARDGEEPGGGDGRGDGGGETPRDRLAGRQRREDGDGHQQPLAVAARLDDLRQAEAGGEGGEGGEGEKRARGDAL